MEKWKLKKYLDNDVKKANDKGKTLFESYTYPHWYTAPKYSVVRNSWIFERKKFSYYFCQKCEFKIQIWK